MVASQYEMMAVPRPGTEGSRFARGGEEHGFLLRILRETECRCEGMTLSVGPGVSRLMAPGLSVLNTPDCNEVTALVFLGKRSAHSIPGSTGYQPVDFADRCVGDRRGFLSQVIILPRGEETGLDAYTEVGARAQLVDRGLAFPEQSLR